MSDDVIPLNEIGKIGTVKVYNQAYVDKQQKRIAELEKKNADLKEEINKIAFARGNLEEENAKLKEALKGKVCRCMIYFNFKDLEKENAKAKELLKKWVELYKPKLEGYPITPIQEQTEQFLSEVEK